MFLKSVKANAELSANADTIFAYIDEKYNELIRLIKSVDEKYSQLLLVVDDIYKVVGKINERYTEDLVTKLENLGSDEDFIQGLNEGLYERES